MASADTVVPGCSDHVVRAVIFFLAQGLLGTVLAPLIAWKKGYRRRDWVAAGLTLGLMAVPLAMNLKAKPDARRGRVRKAG